MEKRDGIKISYLPRNSPNGHLALTATFSVGRESPSRTFVTTEEIRDFIQREKIGRGGYLGRIDATFDQSTKTATWETYEPPHSKGIAQVLELHFKTEAKKRWPELRTWIHHGPFPGRMRQLRWRGQNPHAPYSHEEGIRKLQDKIRKDVLAHRRK